MTLAQLFEQEEKKGIEKGIEKGREEGMQKGVEEGMQKGIEKGREEGMQKGMQKGKLELAKRMIVANIDIQQISEITGFSIKELEELP